MEGRASRERRAWVKEERLVEAAAVADARGHRARGQLVILEGGDWCLKVSSEVLGSGICSIWWDGPGRSRAQRMVWANVLSRKSTLAAAWEPRGKEGRWLVSQSRVYGVGAAWGWEGDVRSGTDRRVLFEKQRLGLLSISLEGCDDSGA